MEDFASNIKIDLKYLIKLYSKNTALVPDAHGIFTKINCT